MRIFAGLLLCLLTACSIAAPVTAQWTHDGLNVDGFRLTYQCESQSGTVPAPALARTLAFDAPAGESCAASMVAYNQIGDSPPSSTVAFTVRAEELPGPVRNLQISWSKQVQTVADFKVQRGSTNIAAGGITATITAGSEYVAPSSTSAAFIRIVSHHGFTNGDSIGDSTGVPGRNMAYITNPGNLLTSITFSRTDTNTSNATAFEWEIVEYIGAGGGANEFIVRDAGAVSAGTGATSIAGATGVTNADPNDIAVFLTGVGSNSGARGESGPACWTASFNATTDGAEFVRDLANGRLGSVSYAVVEFTGSNWAVQRIEHSQSGTGAETETITSVGDLSRAFIHIQHATNTINGPRQMGHEVYLTDVDEITFDIDVMSGTRRFVAWVISNSQTGSGAMSVARYSGTRAANTGSDPDAFTHTVTTVADVEQTSIMGESANNGTSTTDSHYSMLGFRLTDASTVTMTRGRNANSRDYRFEVVQWPSTASGGEEGVASVDAEAALSMMATISTVSGLVLPGSAAISSSSFASVDRSIGLAVSAALSQAAGQISEAAASLSASAAIAQSAGLTVDAAMNLGADAGLAVDRLIQINVGLMLDADAALSQSASAQAGASLSLLSIAAEQIITSAARQAGLSFEAVSNIVSTGTNVSGDIVTPDGRTLRVTFENRVLAIAAEDRTLYVMH